MIFVFIFNKLIIKLINIIYYILYIISNPPIIYKKFHKYKPVDEFKEIQWFALTDNYGTEYGDADGTIIDQDQLRGNKKYPISDLEDPSEIVIWKDYDDLLEELPNNDIGE